MKGEAQHHIVIVSGVPRSGTSMMMRILHDSGVPVVSDEGWSFELGDAGLLTRDKLHTQWVYQVPTGHAIKVLYPTIDNMPRTIHYKVVWMYRKPCECAKSLRKLGGRPRSYIAKAAKNIRVINDGVPKRMEAEGIEVARVSFEALIGVPSMALAPVESLLEVECNPGCVVDRDPKSSDLPLGTLETAQ